MGQYYTPILLKTRNTIGSWISALEIGSYAKLTEHSYVGNEFVGMILRKLYKNPTRLVWAGDYADKEKGKKLNLYNICKLHRDRNMKPSVGFHKSLRYAVNHSKKQFVDLHGCPEFDGGYKFNPLPILCAEGNGRGGGDYHGFAMDLVGYWARDVIETIKISKEIPKGYKEIKPDFLQA